MKFKLKENNIKNVIFGKVPIKKNVNSIFFYDYDGTLLHSYTSNEFLNMTALPSLPDRTSENLTCDGWNWTLSEITSYLNAVDEDVNVGAIYHTTDNKTHITCKPTETYPQAYICLTPTVANDVTVDWGDGTTDIWTTTSAATKSHAYTGVTDSSVYDITISCSSGTYGFNSYVTGGQTNNINCVYTDIKLSNKVTRLSCFYNCYSLQRITIPNSVTSLGSECFYSCYSLKNITIPNSVTSFSDYCFQKCYALQRITIPNSVTSLGSSCFNSCYSLKNITIPSSVTSFGTSCFNSCYSLKNITIPSGVTSLANNCFLNCYFIQSITIPSGVTSLGSNCFASCYSLKSITIPNSVTYLYASCLQNCSSLKKIYMQSTTPPALPNTNAIPNNGNLVIYVPTGSLTAYQNASNWSTFASKMVEYNY